MKIIKINVIFEQDEDGFYVASVPSIPGCYTQGKTLEEAKKRIKEVIGSNPTLPNHNLGHLQPFARGPLAN